jgi:GT2 family glycosyltransferase
MLLSVIIVSYNAYHFLDHCLAAVSQAMQGIDGEVIIIDNCSADGSPKLVKEKFPQFTLVENKVNIGYSKANNQGIRSSRGKYVLLLNPDTVVQPDGFRKSLEYMDAHPEAGALGVRMVDGKGNFLPESKRGFPGPLVSLYKVLRLHKWFPGSKRFDRYYLGYLPENQTNEVDILVGAFMLLRKSVLDEVGLLDEQFFMFWEDTDLSYRITQAGYKNIYFPETTIIHYKGESTRKDTPEYISIFYGAMNVFVRKHFPENTLFQWSVRLTSLALMVLTFLKYWVHRLFLPILDFVLLFGGMIWLVDFWELNYKYQKGFFPDTVRQIAVPAYVAVWMISTFFSGGYDRPFKFHRIVRAVLFGTLLISAVTNFLPEYRFSRALIILGGFYAILAMMFSRWLNLVAGSGKLFRWPNQQKRIAIVGSKAEFERINKVIEGTGLKAQMLGYFHSTHDDVHTYLGPVEGLSELLNVYQPDELIFCLKDMSLEQVIAVMSRHANQVKEYKIVPEGESYAIGSASSKTQGDVYTLHIRLNLLMASARRNKRLFDLAFCFLLILLFPLIGWFLLRPFRAFINAFRVLGAKASWVGYAVKSTAEHEIKLPALLPGILNTGSTLGAAMQDEAVLRRLDFLYARDYHPGKDIEIVWKSLRRLGSST